MPLNACRRPHRAGLDLPLPRWTALAAAALLSTTALAQAPAGLAASSTTAPPSSAAAAAAKPKWDVNRPPGAARTVKLDVRTGSWMSVDVSPDGKTVLFDLLGDLYTLPIEGGDAQPLTTSIAWEHQARFSPDGQRIAFLSDAGGGDNVWVMDRDGRNARAVTTEDFRLLNNPVWHPSGRYLLARKHYTGTRSAGSGEIWMYHLDGAPGSNKGVQLNEKPNWQKDLGEPAVSPDGRWLYYSQDTTPGRNFEYNKNANGEIFKIFRQDLTDGSVEPFVQGPGGAIRPVPSPDGKYLAFVRRIRMQSTLFLKDLSTGREFPAWGGLERDLQESWSVYGVYPAFAWTPDSRQIVVWAQGQLWRVDPFKGEAKPIAFRVQHQREIREALRVPQEVAPDRFDVKQLRWTQASPDGRRVVYSALGQLWIKELAGGAPRRLTQSEGHFEFFPSWSRDGQSVVFTTWHDQNLGSVRRVDVASGRETVLTQQPGKYVYPRLSPDGQQVAFVKQRGGYLTTPWQGTEFGVYVAPALRAGAMVRVAKDGDQPQWGDRNDAVYVSRGQATGEVDFARRLVRVNLADRSETEVARGEYVSEFTVSPDGRWLGFVERMHAFVTPLPASGKPLAVSPRMDSVPVRQLDRTAGAAIHFSGDSRRVHYTLGDEFFTVALDEAFTAPPAAGAAPAAAWKAPEAGVKVGFAQASDKPNGRIALVGGRVVTQRAAQPDEVIDNAVVLVEGNRITAIGAAGQVSVPADAQRIDLRGKTVIPGLIDAHWHGGMGEGEVIPQQSWINHASLAFGVTTIHDPSNRNGEIFTQAELQRAGRVVGPRIYSTGSILYGAKGFPAAAVNSLDDALSHLKRQKAEGAISVKSYQQPRRDQRQQVLEAARQTGMMVVPEGGSMFQLNMSMVIDGHTGIEHAIPIAKVYDDVVQLWSHTGVGYTPTLNVAYGGLDGEHYWYAKTEVWKHPLLSRYVPATLLQARAVRRPTAPDEDFNVVEVAKTAARLQKAGVAANIGAHGQREGLGAHWEMWMFGLGGMTPLEAIRTATLNPARYLGLDKDLGSLEVGKLADLVIIDGDVVKDIRQSDRITHVMQNGRLFDALTMNELAPRKTTRKPFFFEGADGRSMPLDTETWGHHAHED